MSKLFLQIRWIDLSSSAFISHLYSISPLTLSCFESSLLSGFPSFSSTWVDDLLPILVGLFPGESRRDYIATVVSKLSC